jgi:hypothetical protein
MAIVSYSGPIVSFAHGVPQKTQTTIWIYQGGRKDCPEDCKQFFGYSA